MLNPFTNFRQSLFQILNVLLIVASALAVWKGLSVLTNTDAPIVVVLTESMEPAFARGDLLFLRKPSRPLEVGDIVVYKLSTKEIPIVHRLLNIHRSESKNETYYLTKGDNNNADDRGIFAQEAKGKLWIHEHEIMGIVYGFVPSVGYITILLNDNPHFKYAILGVFGILALVTRE